MQRLASSSQKRSKSCALTNSLQAARTSKRLQEHQPVPRVDAHAVVPELQPLGVVGALLARDHQLGDRLEGEFLLVPAGAANVLDGLLLQVLAQLDLQLVLDVVARVELAQSLVNQSVYIAGVTRIGISLVILGLERLVFQLTLGQIGGHQAVPRNVLAEAARRLRRVGADAVEGLAADGRRGDGGVVELQRLEGSVDLR